MRFDRIKTWQAITAKYPSLYAFNIDGNRKGGYINQEKLRKIAEELGVDVLAFLTLQKLEGKL